MNNLIELVKELTQLRGISGNEFAVQDFIVKKIKKNANKIDVDNLGNIIVYKKGAKKPSKKMILSAHMDEVGFIVTGVKTDGMLTFTTVGGVSAGVVLGRNVLVGENKINGIIGAKAIHLLSAEEKSSVCKISDMAIDIGATSQQNALELINLGDEVTFDEPFTLLADNKILSKALDDRIGCAILIELINSQLEYDCYFSFTVQEETGCAGAKTVAYTVDPDIAIAIEATTAADIYGVSEEKMVCNQGEGAAISFMDKGTIYDKGLYKAILNIASKNDIKHQVKQGVYGGNESRNLQTAGNGAKTAAISVPVRYIHSSASVADVRDIEKTLQLLKTIINELPNETI